MPERKTEWISARAYSLWEQSGQNHGNDAEHWQQATLEYEQLMKSRASTDGAELLSHLPRNIQPLSSKENSRKRSTR